MDDLERRTTEMVAKVDNFGNENAAAIAVNAVAVAKFLIVAGFVAQLQTTGTMRTTAGERKFSQSARRRLTRAELKNGLALIIKTAVAVARENPTFNNIFKRPRSNFNDLAILETARAFYAATEALAIKTLFLNFGMPADFREDLLADIDAFETAISQQDTANRDRIDAEATIEFTLKETLKAISTLKVVVPNIFRNDPGKLADWMAASRIEKSPAPPPKT